MSLSFKLSEAIQEPEPEGFIHPAHSFKPTPQQLAVCNWITNSRGNLMLTAVAGAGKTSTLMMAVQHMNGYVTIVAYNRKIADELTAKVRALAEQGLIKANVRVGTFHSLGFGAWRRTCPQVKTEGLGPRDAGFWKFDKISELLLERGIEIPFEESKFVRRLVSLAKQRAFGVPGQTPIDDLRGWVDLINHFNLQADMPPTQSPMHELVAKAQQALHAGIEIATSVIDFDDMAYMPLMNSCRMFTVNWVMVDESQDLNTVRRLMSRKMLDPVRGRAIFVGDPCQPAGTMVTMASGLKKPIQEIKSGDSVRSLRRRDSSFVQSGRMVTGVTKRLYSGVMVTVKSNGRVTKYTNNHYCYASMELLRDKCVVYVMRKGDLWRIGTTHIQSGNVAGFSNRKRIEGADDIWLLKTFDTEREAKTTEFKLSTEYGIPQLIFKSQSPPESRDSYQRCIGLAWLSLDKIKLEHSAIRLLTTFGRDQQYPLNECTSKPGEFWVTRPSRIRACNLMDGMSVLHYKGFAHYSSSDFHPIVRSHSFETCFVYSMNVENDHTYIADGIATFNCQACYGFTGADGDSIDLITQQFQCKELPLTVSFRCPKAVVALAQNWVSHIESAPEAPQGVVERIKFDQFIQSRFGVDDVILCRKNAPLVTLAFRFIRRGIGCRVEGRDIGDGLVELAQKWKVVHLSALHNRLETYKIRETVKLMNRKMGAQADHLADKVETLQAVIEGMPAGSTLPELIKRIESMFQDTAGKPRCLTLSSVHKSKGREWGTVYLLGRNIFMPSQYAVQPWQQEQEINLIYVAVTRAMERFVDVDLPPDGIPRERK